MTTIQEQITQMATATAQEKAKREHVTGTASAKFPNR